MFTRSPEIIAIGLNRAQRDLVVSGPLDFSEADTLPEGLYVLDCWRDEEGDERVFWEITALGMAVRAVLQKRR